MSYIEKWQINELENIFGKPEEIIADQEIGLYEYRMLKSSMSRGRAHDATIFIFPDLEMSAFAGIAKHFFPKGTFRAPSGAVMPGEDFAEGVKREAFEETGLIIRIDKYFLRMKVVFSHCGEKVDWTSHVFSAFSSNNDLRAHDTDEISATSWITFQELLGEMERKFLDTNMGLFRYRTRLHRYSFEQLSKLYPQIGSAESEPV